MPIDYKDIADNHRRVFLSGRLDIQGVDEIDTKFAALTSTLNKRIVVDLTAVNFLASIGIRALISNAKALKQRGGKMVLFIGDNEAVHKTLETTGIDSLIPMFTNLVEADNTVLS